MELLAGVHDVPSENFTQLREQVKLAYELSKGRILEEPRFLLCKEVLRVPFPTDLVPPSAEVLARYLEVVRLAKSREEILERRVPFKGLLTRGKGRAGFETSVLKQLVATPKSEWKERVEALASEIYPRWREHFQETGKRLPDQICRELNSRSTWEAERAKFGESILRWLGGSAEPEWVAGITKRLDAVLEFTIYVVREFLTRDYKLENHESDVYDQFQLHYLAMDRFVIVSKDKDLSMRTPRSSQADRILSFEKFLQSL